MEQVGADGSIGPVPGPAPVPASPARPLLSDGAWLRRQYVDRDLTLRQIGEAAGGAAPWSVARALERAGVPRRPRGKRPGRVPLPGVLSDAAWVRARYSDEGLSLQQVADRAGASARVVVRALREHGVPLRARGPGGRSRREAD